MRFEQSEKGKRSFFYICDDGASARTERTIFINNFPTGGRRPEGIKGVEEHEGKAKAVFGLRAMVRHQACKTSRTGR